MYAMVNPPTVPHRLIAYWLDRHLDPVSFVLHMIGIPPTILGVMLFSVYVGLFSLTLCLFSVALFVGGYLLQFAGHAIERTDPGEIIFFKRKLGLPYVEFPAVRRRVQSHAGGAEQVMA